MDLVSVIIPVYNAEKTINEALNSVIEQSYSFIEIIIINDGSSDNSENVIKHFNDTRIQYYSQVNKGQCAASNFGLTKAKGKYIKFFDADDVMNVTHLEAQILKLNGRIDAVSSCKWGRFYNNDLASLNFSIIHKKSSETRMFFVKE